ncbi:cytochrome c oxidase subunit III (mitochondrion) [Hydra vulgaris]|uniref:Cytochrome c oxidase subunit 3 n=1 Tax=Hydra vulgaris TaxID=6087 RepID=B4F7M4_HYDVU|nr:cytochrome c oxidase subunit III [Hydra vulgaris]ADI99797.1 cytochrome c oxidase subunit III [Hydra vulgaris]BAR90846.1 cytochrome c oxidase subunit III [Hydra vulgaris]BAR90852.1 cytochrome c oxidase subunit III [Hydra vulgaris]BAR90857.1 cytochrome c oxidase subunit III [Hydra vulgaris]BAR90862.1 cytochrome c oxidase subunit III [Hydra vulgaris]
MEKYYHPFHLVNPNPWPFCISMGVLYLTLNTVAYFHKGFYYPLLLSFILIILFMILWFTDIFVESSLEGAHTKLVLTGLKLGFILFIISEILFFFSFFWAFFHSSLSPSVEIGINWPPLGIITLNPFSIPLLNTIILLSSGVSVTWCHHSLIQKNRNQSLISLIITITLGLLFTFLQALEYLESNFCISDSVYGSIFFVATGFHGIHVIIGTIFLSVCLLKIYFSHFTNSRHFTFEAASWYWHFVDVVWLFLYICIYWWGS